MRDLDVKLQEAENYSNKWKPVSIDIVQDQSDNMKVCGAVKSNCIILNSSKSSRLFLKVE